MLPSFDRYLRIWYLKIDLYHRPYTGYLFVKILSRNTMLDCQDIKRASYVMFSVPFVCLRASLFRLLISNFHASLFQIYLFIFIYIYIYKACNFPCFRKFKKNVRPYYKWDGERQREVKINDCMIMVFIVRHGSRPLLYRKSNNHITICRACRPNWDLDCHNYTYAS